MLQRWRECARINHDAYVAVVHPFEGDRAFEDGVGWGIECCLHADAAPTAEQMVVPIENGGVDDRRIVRDMRGHDA